jgi:hypothetical protein
MHVTIKSNLHYIYIYVCVCVFVCVYLRTYIHSLLWGFTHDFQGFRRHMAFMVKVASKSLIIFNNIFYVHPLFLAQFFLDLFSV